MLVLTGVTGPAEAVLAPPSQRPTYLAEDLAGLLEPHPEVTRRDGRFGCGGASPQSRRLAEARREACDAWRSPPAETSKVNYAV
jgi:hypothetical protein